MIIETLRAHQALRKFASLEEASFPLDRAALVLALEEYPELDIPVYLRRLDTLAARLEVLAGMDRNATNIIECLNEILFVQEGLCGNEDDYYDPRNSFLNEVLDRRLGIPISLSIIYMEVARRIGFSLDGIGFPGHFLIKHSSRDGDIIIDAFNRGRILTRHECQDLLDKAHNGAMLLHASHFQPMEKKAMITRMLYNLKDIYLQKEQYVKALSEIEKILILNPLIPSEIRDRGILRMQVGLFANAIGDLEAYLTRTVAPEDSSHIQNDIRMLRDIVCSGN